MASGETGRPFSGSVRFSRSFAPSKFAMAVEDAVVGSIGRLRCSFGSATASQWIPEK
jgi:hypothetical protein